MLGRAPGRSWSLRVGQEHFSLTITTNNHYDYEISTVYSTRRLLDYRANATVLEPRNHT